MNNSFRKKDMICGMSPSFTADFFEGSMKPKVKGGSIPAAGVSGQQLQCNQHNGGMFSTTLTELNVHGGWLGGREGDSGRERLREQEKEGGRERRKEGEKEGGREGRREEGREGGGKGQGGQLRVRLAVAWRICTSAQPFKKFWEEVWQWNGKQDIETWLTITLAELSSLTD